MSDVTCRAPGLAVAFGVSVDGLIHGIMGADDASAELLVPRLQQRAVCLEVGVGFSQALYRRQRVWQPGPDQRPAHHAVPVVKRAIRRRVDFRPAGIDVSADDRHGGGHQSGAVLQCEGASVVVELALLRLLNPGIQPNRHHAPGQVTAHHQVVAGDHNSGLRGDLRALGNAQDADQHLGLRGDRAQQVGLERHAHVVDVDEAVAGDQHRAETLLQLGRIVADRHYGGGAPRADNADDIGE